MPRHFLSIFDLEKTEIMQLIKRAGQLKTEKKESVPHPSLSGKTIVRKKIRQPNSTQPIQINLEGVRPNLYLIELTTQKGLIRGRFIKQ